MDLQNLFFFVWSNYSTRMLFCGSNQLLVIGQVFHRAEHYLMAVEQASHNYACLSDHQLSSKTLTFVLLMRCCCCFLISGNRGEIVESLYLCACACACVCPLRRCSPNGEFGGGLIVARVTHKSTTQHLCLSLWPIRDRGSSRDLSISFSKDNRCIHLTANLYPST